MIIPSSLRAMAYARLGVMGLPSLRFFTPVPGFWEKLDVLVPPNVQLVDAGCGKGDLIEEAANHGRTLLGIDVAPRPGQDRRVRHLNAIEYPWSKTTWPMMCRPSHDGWCWETMQAARKAGATVLYVGLPKNLIDDLGHVKTMSYGVVGEEGEKLWVIDPFKRK